MRSAVKHFIEFLEENARKWDDVARTCDALAAEHDGKEWKARADAYRQSAKASRDSIHEVRKLGN